MTLGKRTVRTTLAGAVAILFLQGFSVGAMARAQEDAVHLSGRAAHDRAVAWRNWVDAETRPVVGIALGGGGARGMAHIGVLRGLENAGIPIERISGTSIGSFIGALVATGAPVDRIEELALKTNWSNLIELKMSRVGFFSTRRLERFINFHLNFLQRDSLRLPSRTSGDDYLASGLQDLQFRDLRVPFVCTATDLYSGRVVVFDSGTVAAAVRASCSIPGLFEPVLAGDAVLVDGGVRLNLPVSLCRRLGAEAVIAVDLESDSAQAVSGLLDILAQIIRIQGRALMDAERMEADAVIAPAVGRIRTTDLSMTRDAIREGEIAGRLAADRIKERLLGLEAVPEAGRPVTPPAFETRESAALVADAMRAAPGAVRRAAIPARQARAALAAAQLGLDRDALALGRALPSDLRTPLLLSALAACALRVGHDTEAARLIAELDVAGAAADVWWRLAAAAIDRRRDTVAGALRERALRAEQSPLPPRP